MRNKNIIIGVDPGLNNTGWGVIESFNNKEKYLSHGVIKTNSSDILGYRLCMIFDNLIDLIKKFEPNHVAVEKIFSNTNPDSTLKLGKARGVIFLVAAKNNIKISEYSPNTVKKNLVGYGHASKLQMIEMISRIYPGVNLADSDDSADALAVATCHSMQSQSKITEKIKEIMIVKLKGFIENLDDHFIDLDVRGVVFRILMSNKNILKLGPIGSQVDLFIYEIIKEDSRIFAGFLDDQERDIFSDLLTVQGVGGKMAINIMSKMDSQVIVQSIHNEDSLVFKNISGVGNKLALRIINELKEKIKKKIHVKKINISEKDNSTFNDLVSCLLNLGFSQKICESTASYVINKNQKKN